MTLAADRISAEDEGRSHFPWTFYYGAELIVDISGISLVKLSLGDDGSGSYFDIGRTTSIFQARWSRSRYRGSCFETETSSENVTSGLPVLIVPSRQKRRINGNETRRRSSVATNESRQVHVIRESESVRTRPSAEVL